MGFPISGPGDKPPSCGDCGRPVRKVEGATVYGVPVFALPCHGVTQRVTKSDKAPWAESQPVTVTPPTPALGTRIKKALTGTP